MPHAWLLAGPKGIGKATLAYRVARFVLVPKAGAAGFFGEAAPAPNSLLVDADNPALARIAAGAHPGLLTIERSVNQKTGKLRGEIVVEDVRRLTSFLAMTAAGGDWRVVVVDVADEMNRNAANALLKGLEEPPPRTVFLLVSHSPGRLLATIRSRCRLLSLSPLPATVVMRLLTERIPDLSNDNAAALAKLSDGSIGGAMRLAEHGGLELYRELVGLLAGLDRLDIKAVHALGTRLGRAGGEDSFELLGRLIDRWLAAMVLGGARGAMAPEIVEGEEGAARLLWSSGGLANWLEVWEKVTRLFSQAGRANLDRKQVVISAFLTLAAGVRG